MLTATKASSRDLPNLEGCRELESEWVSVSWGAVTAEYSGMALDLDKIDTWANYTDNGIEIGVISAPAELSKLFDLLCTLTKKNRQQAISHLKKAMEFSSSGRAITLLKQLCDPNNRNREPSAAIPIDREDVSIYSLLRLFASIYRELNIEKDAYIIQNAPKRSADLLAPSALSFYFSDGIAIRLRSQKEEYVEIAGDIHSFGEQLAKCVKIYGITSKEGTLSPKTLRYEHQPYYQDIVMNNLKAAHNGYWLLCFVASPEQPEQSVIIEKKTIGLQDTYYLIDPENEELKRSTFNTPEELFECLNSDKGERLFITRLQLFMREDAGFSQTLAVVRDSLYALLTAPVNAVSYYLSSDKPLANVDDYKAYLRSVAISKNTTSQPLPSSTNYITARLFELLKPTNDSLIDLDKANPFEKAVATVFSYFANDPISVVFDLELNPGTLLLTAEQEAVLRSCASVLEEKSLHSLYSCCRLLCSKIVRVGATYELARSIKSPQDLIQSCRQQSKENSWDSTRLNSANQLEFINIVSHLLRVTYEVYLGSVKHLHWLEHWKTLPLAKEIISKMALDGSAPFTATQQHTFELIPGLLKELELLELNILGPARHSQLVLSWQSVTRTLTESKAASWLIHSFSDAMGEKIFFVGKNEAQSPSYDLYEGTILGAITAGAEPKVPITLDQVIPLLQGCAGQSAKITRFIQITTHQPAI